MTFSLNNFLFGPLDGEYCAYFYILSVINYIFFIFIITSLIVTLVFQGRKADSKSLMTMLFGALLYGVIYFQNRLLHSMCMKTENIHINPTSKMY